MRKVSNNQKSALNITACIILVAINTCINFFLSPFIVKHLGVEANGYITLANNFVSYFGLVVTALNSMAGRFMLIEIRRKKSKEANEYYSSVLFGDWILAGILLVPCLILILKLEWFINVPNKMLFDIKLLFALVFLNMFISLLLPKWNNATYITNNLYLRSLKGALSAIVRALVIVFLYSVLPPFAFFVAVAGVIMTLVNITCEFCFKRRLLPQLRVKFSDFNFKKIKTLISSGIWNTVSQCGGLLLEGLDILIANLFINPTASGLLALSKVIPNMINQIVGNVATTFGPRLTAQFADNDTDGMEKTVKNNLKVVAFLANIPIGITFAFGTEFFSLWVPSENPKILAWLSSITLIGMTFSGISRCIINIFGATNKLKVNSLVIILSGLVNAFTVFVLLKTTNLGVYAIAGVSSIIAIARELGFTATYAAKCIGKKWNTFQPTLLFCAADMLIPIICGIAVKQLITVNSWISFIIAVGISCILTVSANYFVLLNKQEKQVVLKLLRIKK